MIRINPKKAMNNEKHIGFSYTHLLENEKLN